MVFCGLPVVKNVKGKIADPKACEDMPTLQYFRIVFRVYVLENFLPILRVIIIELCQEVHLQ